MIVNLKHIIVSAILVSVFSITLQGVLLFQNSPGGGGMSSVNLPHPSKLKSTDSSVDSNHEIGAKALQDQKAADVNKIIMILAETQSLVTGKKNLNPGLAKSFEKLSLDIDAIVKPYNLEDVKLPTTIKNQTDILKLGAYVGLTLRNISSAANGLNALNALSPSANSFTNPNSFFDLQRIAKDSPLRKISEVFQFYAKNVDLVQRNAFDLETMQNLQKVVAEGVDQIKFLDSKYESFNSQVRETINNLRQTPWPVKSSQLNSDLQIYIESLKGLNKALEDKGNFKKASETLDVSFPKKLFPATVGSVKPKDDTSTMQNLSDSVNLTKLLTILDEVKREISAPKSYSNQALQSLSKLSVELREELHLPASNEFAPIDLSKPPKVPKNQLEVIETSKVILQVLEMTASLEKPLTNVAALGSTAAIIAAPNAFLDVQKIPVESSIRSLALSFDEAQKASLAWQKNIVDTNAIGSFLTALSHTNEQFSAAEAGMNAQNPTIEETVIRLRQVAWQNKSQEAKQTLMQLKEQLTFIRKQLLDTDKIARAASTEGSEHALGILLTGRVWQSLPFSMEIFILLCLSTILWLHLRSEKLLQTPALTVEDDLEKRTPYIAEPFEKKTSDLMPELHQQVASLEQKFIQSYQSSDKVLAYLQEVMLQVAELRTVHLNDGDEPSYLHIDVSQPLEDIDAALLSLKQIGIRLFLSILGNHSTRQLALETEHMNSLVEKTEVTFANLKHLVVQVNQKALPKRDASDQAGMDLIELDLNQVLKEVQRWQDELTQMNQAIMSLNTLVGQYV